MMLKKIIKIQPNIKNFIKNLVVNILIKKVSYNLFNLNLLKVIDQKEIMIKSNHPKIQ